MKLLCLFTTPDQQNFLQTLTETFADMYDIDCLPADDYTADLDQIYQALLSWQSVETSLPQVNLGQLDLEQETDHTRLNLKLARALVNLHQELLAQTLQSFPYQASLANANGHILATNGKPTDPFDWEADKVSAVPAWIMATLKDKPDQAFHLTVPSPAFDRILVQTYQACLSENHDITGVFHYVQDIKPLLNTYLQETGQALVGWSDVTSGASIHNDTFDY